MLSCRGHGKGDACNNLGFFGLYGQGGLTRAAKRSSLDVTVLQVLDLSSQRPDGQNWDFTRREDRRWAMRILKELSPLWVSAAPPCTTSTQLSQAINDPKLSVAESHAKVQEGFIHLEFVANIYRFQIRHQRSQAGVLCRYLMQSMRLPPC